MVISQQSVRAALLCRVAAPVVLASALALTLGACSAGSPATSGSGTKSGSGTTVATATFSGAESGKVTMNLCDSSGADSIFVQVDGTDTKLPGVVSASNMDFDGTDSIYTIDKTGPLPSVSTDGNSVTLDGVILKSVIDPTKKLTFAGKITCP